MQYVFAWSEEKNNQLKQIRNVSFEDVLVAVSDGAIIADEIHPNQDKYPNQYRMIIEMNDYVYIVPYVVNDAKKHIFLKTIIPSRKEFKKYKTRTYEE